MENEQITFDKLSQAVGYLTEQMEEIRQMVVTQQQPHLFYFCLYAYREQKDIAHYFLFVVLI